MSTQILLHSKRLSNHSNYSKVEFLTSYAHQTLKYVHSYISIYIYINYSKNQQSTEIIQKFLTSYAPQTLKNVHSNFSSFKESTQITQNGSSSLHMHLKLSSMSIQIFFHSKRLRSTQITQKRSSSPHMHLKPLNASHQIVMPKNA